jgi:hypothetical protein
MHRTKVRAFFNNKNCFQSKPSFLLIYVFDRFFETEGIAVLAMLISQYKIAIKDEPQFAGETFEERKSRILSVHAVLTLTYVIYFFHVSFFILRIDE